jgi:hypothetical protein
MVCLASRCAHVKHNVLFTLGQTKKIPQRKYGTAGNCSTANASIIKTQVLGVFRSLYLTSSNSYEGDQVCRSDIMQRL